MWIETLGRALDRCGRAPARLFGRVPPRALVAGALLGGLAVRVIALCAIEPSPHEAHYLRDAHTVLERGMSEGLRGSVHGWLAALANAQLLRVWPDAAERELRWAQLAHSMLALVAVWLVGRAAAGERAAAFAVLVHALTPNAVFYAASAEPYAAHLVLVTAMLAAYVAFVRRASPGRGAWVALVSTVAALHHPVALVNAAALGLHALATGAVSRRARLQRCLPFVIALAAAAPMLRMGQPSHARNWLGATIPYFFSIDVVGSVVVFLVLWDACAERLEPVWRDVLPWAFVVPVLFWLPHGRLQYLLPGSVPMAIVVGAALASGARVRVVGAMLFFVAANALSAIADGLHALARGGG
ncbi:MAG: glycosyltransferase family 39 protein [bacterium]